MADKVTLTATARFDCAFVDGDTRSFNLPNPNNETMTSTAIGELNRYIQANNILIGDKENATFAQINKVTRIRKQTTTLDLTSA